MKQRSTTPELFVVSVLRCALLLTILLAVVLGVTTTSHAESNVDRTKRIEDLTREIDKAVSSTRELNTQSDSVTSQIQALERERSYLESQMQKNTTDQELLSQQISQTEASLEERRSALGQIMADLYFDDTISPLEMLASSNSIADFLDGHVYRTTIREELQRSINEVRAAEAKLVTQRADLQKVAGQQQNQKLALSQKQTEQSSVLARVQSQSGQLEAVTAEMAAERKELQTRQQASVSASLSGAEMVAPGTISAPIATAPSPPAPAVPTNPSPGSPPQPTPASPASSPPVVLPNGGYPAYLQNCYVDANAWSYGIDPWGYGCRQCVSYTAWKVLQKIGRPAMYWGNAKDWPASARRAGYATGSSPRAGSVAVMTGGPYGHVAWVESVNANGTLNISQYNYWLPNTSNGGWGWYSEFRNVSPSIYQVYIYI